MPHVSSADGTPIAYERLGSGPPVLLIGGALCDRRARAAGLPLAKALAPRFTVICFDRRGRGESGSAGPYAPAREVEDVAALLRALGGAPAVYGHSSGALLALEAAHAGLPISKLALYEAPLVLGEGRTPLPENLVERLRSLSGAAERSEAVALFLTRAVGIPEDAVEQMKFLPNWPSLTALAHTLSHDAELARDPHTVLSRARSLTTPALVLDGTQSPAWLRLAVEKLSAALPHAEHSSLPDQTHDVAPAQLAPRLVEFFSREA